MDLNLHAQTHTSRARNKDIQAWEKVHGPRSRVKLRYSGAGMDVRRLASSSDVRQLRILQLPPS